MASTGLDLLVQLSLHGQLRIDSKFKLLITITQQNLGPLNPKNLHEIR